jgi:hypothetical protein
MLACEGLLLDARALQARDAAGNIDMNPRDSWRRCGWRAHNTLQVSGSSEHRTIQASPCQVRVLILVGWRVRARMTAATIAGRQRSRSDRAPSAHTPRTDVGVATTVAGRRERARGCRCTIIAQRVLRTWLLRGGLSMVAAATTMVVCDSSGSSTAVTG